MSHYGLGGVGRTPLQRAGHWCSADEGAGDMGMAALPSSSPPLGSSPHFLTILGGLRRILHLAVEQKTRAEAGIQFVVDKMLERWAGPHKTLQTTSKQQLALLTAPAEMNGIPALASSPLQLLLLQLWPDYTKRFSLLHLLFDVNPSGRACWGGK